MSVELLVSAIGGALAAGAASGVTDVAKQGLVDAYQGFKSLLVRKFGSHSEVSKSLAALESKPNSQGRQTTLVEELEAVHADQDPELQKAAHRLLTLIQSQQSSIKNYNMHIDGNAYGNVQGDNAHVTNHFTLPDKR